MIRAREILTRSSDQVRSWRGWHRLWRRMMRRAAAPPDGQGYRRAFVRICMYCERVHAALPLVSGLDETDHAWRSVPSWVRDRVYDPSLRLVLSHGMCPACSARHMNDW